MRPIMAAFLCLGAAVVSPAFVGAAEIKGRPSEIIFFDYYSRDAIFALKSNPPACDQGYWLRPSHPMYEANIDLLRRAHHSSVQVVAVGADDQRWPESDAKFCRLVSLKVLQPLAESNAISANHPLVGTWKIQSYVREYPATGTKSEPFGPRPTGYLTYTADGHVQSFISFGTRRGTARPATQKELADILRSTAFYYGTYATEGASRLLHHVDISSNESLIGTDRVWVYAIAGDTLTVTTETMKYLTDKEVSRGVLVWKKLPAGAIK